MSKNKTSEILTVNLKKRRKHADSSNMIFRIVTYDGSPNVVSPPTPVCLIVNSPTAILPNPPLTTRAFIANLT